MHSKVAVVGLAAWAFCCPACLVCLVCRFDKIAKKNRHEPGGFDGNAAVII